MQKIVALLSMLISLSFAEGSGTVQIVKLSQKGEKIAEVLCQADKLPKAKGTIEELMDTIAASGACKKLSKTKLKAVAYYVSNGSMKPNANAMKVPEGAKCPVCGMFVSKYPKWAAMMDVNGHKHYFDGVKDMMKYYIFDADFPYDRKRITQISVTDFYTLEAIPARFAHFVLGSEVFGPMGNELIPFHTEEAAKSFIKDHGGEKIVRFKDITPRMVMALDGIEYKEN
jgi:nitrous oxide reductase accessory protein NosL